MSPSQVLHADDAQALEAIIHTCANPNALLRSAATAGAVRCAEVLLTHRADPNHADSRGLTPLHLTCGKSHHLVARVLLAFGADPNHRDAKQRTPLHRAALWGRTQIIQLLLAYGANPTLLDAEGNSTLALACASGDATAIEAILGACRWSPASMHPLLYRAVETESIDVLEVLLAHGADLLGLSAKQDSLIHAAAQNGYLAFLKKIRPGRKFDILLPLLDKPNDDGITPLHLAAEGGYADACVCLLDLGANALLPHPVSRLSPLQIATLEGLDQVVEYALDHHVPDTVAPLVNKSLLCTAIEANSEDLVRSLLERSSGSGIDVSALLAACEHGKRAIVQILLDYNANPNASEQVYGVVPLHAAANMGDRALVELLLSAKADPLICDSLSHSTARRYAEFNGHLAVAALLREAELQVEHQKDQQCSLPVVVHSPSREQHVPV